MYRFIYSSLLLFCISISVTFSQNATLKGRVIDNSTGESIPMASVALLQDGVIINGTSTDFDGYYTIKPIPPGTYNVRVSFIGYQAQEMDKVVLSPNKISVQNFNLSAGEELQEVVIIESDVPLIDPDKSGSIKTKEQIAALPTRNVQSVAATTAGVFQADSDGALNIRGSRSSATDFYVDGVKITGNVNDILPQDAIDQMTVITGGLPAQYGDATGGIVSVTTRGPSSITRGGLELVSSSLTDPYNYNLLSFNLSGPLWRKKDENRTPILGYLITGEYSFTDDPDPSAVGVPQLKSGILEDIQQNPSEFVGIPNFRDYTTVYSINRAEYLRESDWDIVDVKPNAGEKNLRLQGKLDFSISSDINLTIGGSFSNRKLMVSDVRKYLLNSDANYEYLLDNFNIYGRIQHKLSGNDEGAVLKNVFYTLQADYSKYSEVLHDPRHGENYFAYGYVGKFSPETNYDYSNTPFGWETKDIMVVQENGDTIYETHTGAVLQEYITYDFTPGSDNPNAANFTQQYYDYFHQYLPGLNPSMDHVVFGGGLRNGDDPPYVYSMWYNSGQQNYTFRDIDDIRRRIVGSASADIGNHAIQFGFEYERFERSYYSVYGPELWALGRQLANQHLQNKRYFIDDQLQWQFGEDFLIFSSEYIVSQEQYSTFGQNIREKFNIPDNEWVYIDEYTPDQLSIDMFSADELLDNGNLSVYYFGYDYKGNPVSGQRVSFDEFLNDQDNDGNFTRRISPFEPIYTAGYIQDKFFFDDIVFNVGLRVDRYDANQEVLKDKYSLFPVRTAQEVDPSLNPTVVPDASTGSYSHPSNIGDDFVVYANSINDQNQITGYRDGDNWYDATGLPITDPSVLNLGSGVIPFLQDPDHVSKPNGGMTGEAFEDYTPQISVMPRISFNFPISDQAMFFAHYDILTQRPSSSGRMNPYDYLYIASRSSGIQNPNLLPEKTIDYEVGFTQALTDHSAITISAFYRNLQDMIQATRINYAYPITYTTYDNIDFGNVKGFSFGYDLRRTNNVTFNANYTLQFADGTGSSSTTAADLVNEGFPNLRVTLPLDFDQRHNLTANIDYRYGSGINYNGPTLFGGKKILSDFGVNLMLTAGSGTPYSQQSNVTQEAQFGIPIKTTLEGTVNGSRKPWSFRADLKVNKKVNFSLGEIAGDERKLSMNVYVWVQNLLNTDNVINVYRYTGNPDDDGYVSSAEGQQDISQQIDPAAFVDQYGVKVNNPNNYSRPRTIRVGVTMNF